MRKLLFPLVALGLLLLSLQTRAADEDAKAVIEKSIKAHGGAAALDKLKLARIKSKGTMVVMGKDVKFTSEQVYQLPNKSKLSLQIDFGGKNFKTVQVMNGNKAWMTILGNTMDVEGDQLKSMQEEGYSNGVETLVPLVKDKMYELAVTGEEKVDGKPATVVRVKAKGHKDIDLYIDKDNHYLVRVKRKAYDSDTQQDALFETTYTDFKDYDGVKQGAKAHIKKDDKKFADIEVTDLKVLDKVDPNEFNKDL